LNKTLLIHPDIYKRTKILMELFYITHLWTRLFEVAHNWTKLLQIGKIWYDWWTSAKSFQLCKCFCCHPSLIEAFLICPDLSKAVVPYPNAPISLKYI